MTLPAATCAVCRLPIVKGKGFLLVGTEVIHKKRACLLGLGESVLSKATANANRLQQVARRANELAETSGAEIKRLRAENDRLRERAYTAEVAIDRERAAASSALSASSKTIAKLTIERENARIEAASARSEAALHQTIQGAADNVGIFQIVKPDEQKAEPEQKKQDEDASATRFSLLELT